jgi:hypothetical protein
LKVGYRTACHLLPGEEIPVVFVVLEQCHLHAINVLVPAFGDGNHVAFAQPHVDAFVCVHLTRPFPLTALRARAPKIIDENA